MGNCVTGSTVKAYDVIVVTPQLLGIRADALVSMYVWRLRRHGIQELLAAGGIAVGVALVFGVLVANTGLTGPSSRLLRSVSGSADLALIARSEAGFDQGLEAKAAKLAGVKRVAPLIRESVNLVGPRAHQAVQLIGVSPGATGVGGAVAREPQVDLALLGGQLGIPAGVASAIGARGGQGVNVLVDGVSYGGPTFVLAGGHVQSLLSGSSVAIASLSLAQGLTRKSRRLSELLVEPRPRSEQLVTRELRRLAAGRLDVESSGEELRRLKATARPDSQATTLFAAIGATVGFLFTLNAMLLTAPERRRFIVELRILGFDTRRIFVLLGFQTLMLGLLASLAGLALGLLLSHTLLRQTPAYLAFAFPVGTTQTVSVTSVVLALGSGLAGTFLALAPTVIDLRRRRGVASGSDAQRVGTQMNRRAVLRLGSLGVILVLAASTSLWAFPSLTLVGGVMLTLATLCFIPLLFWAVVEGLGRVGEHLGGGTLTIAVTELRGTPLRYLGLAGVAALAVYGGVAIRGARQDLVGGLEKATGQFFATADIWVTSDASEFVTTSFQAGELPRLIAQSSAVAAVRIYQGGLLNVGERRMWIRARPAGDSNMVEDSQLLAGNQARASRLIRNGGWASVSGGFAREHNLGVGDFFSLPTPTGAARLRVAAITTNAGWSPGVITLAASDYSRLWRTAEPTALEVDLKPGVGVTRGRRAIARVLGRNSGLQAQGTRELDSHFDQNVEQGLRSLGEISTLLLISAALAVASALGAAIWERRPHLAALMIQGFDRSRLWRAMLLESMIVVGVGCATGAILGLGGHRLADRWLEAKTGFPAPFSLGLGQAFTTVVLVTAVSLAVIVFLGGAAAQVSARSSLVD